jgi:catechol 2,3-dioxygenase-like lactoylglutathione lyase family enzyme
MNLVSTRIITEDVKQLVAFYEQITGITAIHYTEDFAKLVTPTAALAIGSTRTLQFFGGDAVAQAAKNRSVIIEFQFDDVDTVYEKIELLIEPYLVHQPKTMPWGNRSLLFRDPDGNLVNFFTIVTPQATAK